MDNDLYQRYNLRCQTFFKNSDGEPFTLTPSQSQLFDLIYNPEILRGSCLGFSQMGKSEVASIAIDMLLAERKEKVLIIAPSDKQADIIMGKCISHLFDNGLLTSMIDYYGRLETLRNERSKNRITMKNGSEVMTLTANVEDVNKQAKNLMGFGATIVIVDERPLIPDAIFSKILRMVGGSARGKIVLLGNAFPDSEQFQKTFMPNSRYKSLVIDYKIGLQEGRLTQEFLDEAKEDMTDLDFQIFYECTFPATGADNGVIPLAWIQRATNQGGCRGEYKQAGIDVARFGRDKTVYLLRYGNEVTRIEQTEKMDTMEVAGWVRAFLDGDKPDAANIDVIGIGSGVYDRLKEMEYDYVYPLNASSSPNEKNKEKFYNKRAEMFWTLRDLFKPDTSGRSQISIPDDPDLKKELSQLRYKYSSDKRIKIEEKEEMKKRLGKSPDKADALALAFSQVEVDEAVLVFA